MQIPLASRVVATVILAAAPWLNPATYGPSPSVLPWLVTAACTVGIWLTARGRPLPPAGLLAAAVALFLCAMLTTTGLRPELLFLAGGLALALLAASAATDLELAMPLQAGVLAAAVLSALLGLAQYAGLAATLAPWIAAAEPGSAFANLRQPNQYSSLCWIGIAVLVFGRVALPRPATLLLALLLAWGCAASVSRTGIVQATLVALLAAWWPGVQRRWRVVLATSAAMAYLLGSSMLPVLFELMTGGAPERRLFARLGDTSGCGSRLVLWSNVLRLVAERPLAGWGWGNLDLAHYLTLYPDTRFCDILDNAHNLPLHLAAELGLPVALLACGGALAWAVRHRPWRESDPLRQLAWALLALAILHSLLEYPLWYGPFQLLFGLAVGWLLVPVDPAVGRMCWPPRLAGAVALLAACGYVGWDYARVAQIYVPPGERLAPWREDSLAHARRSWLFSGPADFADLTLAKPSPANAATLHALAQEVLHYSPEPRVIERLIESALLLGRKDEALLHLARYRAAFPREYQSWRAAHPAM